MDEYIERETAIDRLEKLFQLQAPTARTIIEAIPAADVVPVVRCKDCRYSMDDKIFGGMWCRGRKITPDWFCADGTKMDGEA